MNNEINENLQPSGRMDLPAYKTWLQGLSLRYRQSQIKASIAVNVEMLKFYWSLGADIVRMETDQPWGSKFMQHLSDDIRREIPQSGCFSRINLYYMKWFYELYCMRPIVPQAGEQLPEGSSKRALEKFLPADFVSDLPEVENIEEDQTRRLQLLLARGGIVC